jgi:TolA-binding protein
VVEHYSDLPEARDTLFDHALSQTVRASIDAGSLPGAKTALDQLLRDFPKSPQTSRALFEFGLALVDAGEFAQAQEAFADFQRRFPDSPLIPEVRMATARSYARQSDWASAIPLLDQWLAQHTNQVDRLRPQAEFERAWCYYQAGNETNAFVLLTNLVQRHPASSVVPLAHLWLGDYYLNQRDYVSAERSYQFLSTNAVAPELTRQASLMAAKAAFFRQGWSDARNYLTPLVDDPVAGAEAWFMLGDIEMEDRSGDTTNRFSRWEEAIKRFQRVTNFYASSPLAPFAMGKIANCHFQLAAQNTNRYEMATNQYFQLLSVPTDVATRSQAEVVLGHVLEKMAEFRANRTELLNTALDHYLSVVYGKRLQEGEDPDPYWVKEAALAAGTLAPERLQRFEEAERLYEAMIRSFPSSKTVWEKRLASLRQQRSR